MCAPPPAIATDKKRRGFNLIEAAVVLVVVGLVIGGIWYAAASVQQSQRINNTAAGILQIAGGARRLFPYSDYPTVIGTETGITSAVAAAGILPSDFKYTVGVVGISPIGAHFYIALSYIIHPCTLGGTVCPQLQVAISGPGLDATITSSDCIQIIRRFGGLAKDTTDLYSIRLSPSGLAFYPPINSALVTCPENTSWVKFYFRP